MSFVHILDNYFIISYIYRCYFFLYLWGHPSTPKYLYFRKILIFPNFTTLCSTYQKVFILSFIETLKKYPRFKHWSIGIRLLSINTQKRYFGLTLKNHE